MAELTTGRRLPGRFTRAALLLSVSALCLSAVPDRVSAQTLDNELFVSVYGGYLFNESDKNVSFADTEDRLGGLSDLAPGEDGHQIGGAIGVPLSERFDFRAAFTGESFSDDEKSVEDYGRVGSFAEANSHFSLRYLDLELGYRPGVVGMGNIRLFAGPRIINAFNSVDAFYFEPREEGPDKIGDYEANTEVWGIGPRVGAEGGFKFGDSGVSLFLMGAGSAIFSHVDREDRRQETFESDFEDDSSDTRTVYSLEGKIALGYDMTPSVNFQIGYQAQQWWNLLDNIEINSNSGTIERDGTADVMTHGPFARITVKLP